MRSRASLPFLLAAAEVPTSAMRFGSRMSDYFISPGVQTALIVTIGVYLVFLFFLGVAASKRVQSIEDYIVAGRRLPVALAVATLLATWFCAGTMLTSADEVRAEGLRAAALDPFGAGACLLIVGVFFALPLWSAKLNTLSDLFARKFGVRVEILSALLAAPTYMLWVGEQFVATGDVLSLIFGVPQLAGILLIAGVGLAYTLTGGMWSVTLTDAAQLVILVIGLVALLVAVSLELGAGDAMLGLMRIPAEVPEGHMTVIPIRDQAALMTWAGAFLAGSLGNVPMQDVMQRVFSSKSARVARQACLWSGFLYIGLGLIPLTLGLAATIVLPDAEDSSTVAVLAHLFMHPVMSVIFVVTLLSAVLSTITSGLLAPAVALSQNVLPHFNPAWRGSLGWNRIAVVFMAVASVACTFITDDAYVLLEASYEFGMVALLWPLTMATFSRRTSPNAALLSMLTGSVSIVVHYVIGAEYILGIEVLGSEIGIGCTVLSILGWYVGIAIDRPRRTPSVADDMRAKLASA